MLNRSSLARPLTAAALAIGLAGLAACSTSSTLEQPKPDVTNAEVASFQNVQPGSEEDFILNVGRRTYFTQGSAELDSSPRPRSTVRWRGCANTRAGWSSCKDLPTIRGRRPRWSRCRRSGPTW